MNMLYVRLLASLMGTVPAMAQQNTMRANITGNALDGKCTIEVNVDGAAEVEVQGDIGRIRTLAGQSATWRRFVCNGRMPANPADFRFRGIDGRGDVQLVQDPRRSGGRVVFRIDDRQGGREGYTVDLEWRGSRGGQWSNQDTRGWRGASGMGEVRGNQPDRDRRYYDERGRWNQEGAARAIRFCQDAAAARIQQDGFRNVTFRDVRADNNPGRNDWVGGLATARRGPRDIRFQFSCSVDLASGRVRSVNVDRR